MIVYTVMKLPNHVREYIYEECHFLSVGVTCWGMVMPKLDGWLILLEERIVKEFDEGNAMSIVAHEIAHAWLKHDRADSTIDEQCEKEAAEKTKEWGFEGLGTNLEHVMNI